MGGLMSSSSDVTGNWKETAEYSWIQEQLNTGKIVIFSKTTCPYCRRAKGIFDKLGERYTALEVNTMSNCSTLQSILGKMTGATTVPRIFINGESIGGCDDLKALQANGKLDQLLNGGNKS